MDSQLLQKTIQGGENPRILSASASALSFECKEAGKPVVVTQADWRESSDALRAVCEMNKAYPNLVQVLLNAPENMTDEEQENACDIFLKSAPDGFLRNEKGELLLQGAKSLFWSLKECTRIEFGESDTDRIYREHGL